jgi:gluconolactonase
MLRILFMMVLSVGLTLLSAGNKKTKSIVASGAMPEKLAGGFGFTEGPAVDSKGNIYFTDQPNDKIYIWSTPGKLTVFCNGCGRANGLFFDTNGNLITCSDMDNELWSVDMQGNHTVLVAGYRDKRLNGPNDLWISPGGGVYFTDPLYVRPYWTRNPAMQQDGHHVYYLSPGRETVTRVADDLEKPNGIIGTPDGRYLYIADIGAGKTYRYSILPDGNLTGKKLFAPMGSDGMTIDNRGNIYLTGHGVSVFSPDGEKIFHIPVEARWTANVCFGGKNRKTLFITASEYLYALRMKVKGVK